MSGAAFALNYDVHNTVTPPVIDGSGGDSVWSNANPALSQFVVYNAVTELSNEQTQVRALWDSSHLYLLYETDDTTIVPSATGHDTGFLFSAIDNAEFYLDPSWSQTTTQNDRVYHIAVDPAPTAYTYTESGNGQTTWGLTSASQVAFSSSSTSWTVEMAIAWSDLNSTESKSPGVVQRAPIDGTIWGAQFARTHSTDAVANNTGFSKWNNVASGGYRVRPIGTLTFKGGTAATKIDLSTGTLNKVYDFEAPTYTADVTVVGLENWVANNPATWTASNVQKVSGAQSLRVGANPTGQTLSNTVYTDNSATPQYVQYALRLPSEQINAGSYRHVIYLQGEYSTGNLVDAMGQIWFRNSTAEGSNVISVVSFENPLNETQTTTTNVSGLLSYDNWMWLTVKADPVEKTFQVWLNDTKIKNAATGSDRFTIRRKSSFVQLNYAQLYNKNYGTDPVYIDDLTYVEDPQDSGVSDWQLF